MSDVLILWIPFTITNMETYGVLKITWGQFNRTFTSALILQV